MLDFADDRANRIFHTSHHPRVAHIRRNIVIAPWPIPAIFNGTIFHSPDTVCSLSTVVQCCSTRGLVSCYFLRDERTDRADRLETQMSDMNKVIKSRVPDDTLLDPASQITQCVLQWMVLKTKEVRNDNILVSTQIKVPRLAFRYLSLEIVRLFGCWQKLGIVHSEANRWLYWLY